MLGRHSSFPPRSSFLKKPGGRRMFSAEEDNRLKSLVSQIADPDWKHIAAQMTNRTPRQCRERYKNYLSPDLSTRPWSESEDDLLRQKVGQIGQRWAQISHFFNGRSDVSLKNRWAAISTGVLDRRPSDDSPPAPPPPQSPEPPPPPPAAPPEKSEPELPPFLLGQPLWSKEEQKAIIWDESGAERVQMLSAFRNYGGHIW